MCGIVGIARRPGTGASSIRPTLERMADTIVHRGPDDVGFVIQDDAGLGIRRLSIVDVEGGHQPFVSEDGRCHLVVNGEIYNAPELRTDLRAKGHVFRTESDGEVILHLYEEHGIEAVRELRGMFAFALYDGVREELHLARDLFGIKPLYYAELPGRGVVFGSEVKAVLASGEIEAELDVPTLWDYLTFQYAPGRRTLFEGIVRVPPGGRIVFKDGRITEYIWGEVSLDPRPGSSLDEAVARVRGALEASVDRHTMGDLPVGALLSSGVDSSLLAALLARRGPVSTFSVGWEGAEGERDELPIAAELARAIGADHHDVRVGPERYADTLTSLVWYQEDLVADPAAPGIYFATELARPTLKVLFSGEGADELFGGYPIYREPRSLQGVSSLPPFIRSRLGRWASYIPEGIPGRSYLMRGSLSLEERFVGGAKIFTEDAKRDLIRGGAGEGFIPFTEITAQYWQASRGLDPASRMQDLDLHLWLPGDILTKADRMSMANSVEVRVPYLDQEVYATARELPPEYKIRGITTKLALRMAAEPFLPEGFAGRPKLGFPVPLRPWMKGPMRDFVHDHLETIRDIDAINFSTVERLLQEEDQGLERSRPLFTLLNLAIWHRLFMRQAAYPAQAGGVAP